MRANEVQDWLQTKFRRLDGSEIGKHEAFRREIHAPVRYLLQFEQHGASGKAIGGIPHVPNQFRRRRGWIFHGPVEQIVLVCDRDGKQHANEVLLVPLSDF